MQREDRDVYWLIHNPNDPDKQYQYKSSYRLSFNKTINKINHYVSPGTVPPSYILHDRGNGFDNVVIDNDESLRIAYEYMGDDIFDVKKGMIVWFPAEEEDSD